MQKKNPDRWQIEKNNTAYLNELMTPAKNNTLGCQINLNMCLVWWISW